MRLVRILILTALVALVALIAPFGPDTAQAAPGNLTPAQLSTITDQYLFHTSPAKFRQLHKTKPYNGQLNWTTDTCSWSPDQPSGYDFRTACQRHDFGYRNYKGQHRLTEANRKRIDDNFRKDMYGECSKQRGPSGSLCRQIANRYYDYVRKHGR